MKVLFTKRTYAPMGGSESLAYQWATRLAARGHDVRVVCGQAFDDRSRFEDHGVDEIVAALDTMLAAAPPPERAGRPRQFLDRIFTIHGAGTVVTGTLTGGPIAVGQEAEVLPSGHRARIRGWKCGIVLGGQAPFGVLAAA